MGKQTSQRIIIVAFCLSGIGVICGAVSAAAPAKPLVVVFASPPDDTPASGVTATQQSPDGLLNTQRTQLAVRAIRDRFDESNVADAVIYAPDSPVFIRAAQEAKLQIKNATLPSADERVALGKAIGAVSVMTVRAQPIKEKQGSIEVLLVSTEVGTRKTWNDRIVAGSVLDTLPTEISVGDGIAKKSPVENTTWMSASNTLVIRYLAGPLGEYTRALAPAGIATIRQNQFPQTAPPEPQTTSALPVPAASGLSSPALVAIQMAAQDQVVRTAHQQAAAFISGGDTTSAIVILRKAVNQAPRSLPLRTDLARAYLSAGRAGSAADEARRALSVAAPDVNQEMRAETVRVLADAYAKSGDNAAAKKAYEEILATQPQAYWARLALGDLLQAEGDSAGAENAYRTVRQADPANRDALLGVARLLIAKGDYNGALTEIGQGTGAAGATGSQLATVSALFDEISTKTADAVTQNRLAFDGGQLSREAFFRATQAQSGRITSLLALLVSSAPPSGSPEGITGSYGHRKLAASLLSQAIEAMLGFLQDGDKKSGEQAKLLITEFRKELDLAR